MKLFGYTIEKTKSPQTKLNKELWTIYENWMQRFNVSRHFADNVFMDNIEKYILKRERQLLQPTPQRDQSREGGK